MDYQLEPSVLALCHGKWDGTKFIKSEASEILNCCYDNCKASYKDCMDANHDLVFCGKNDVACRNHCFLYNYSEDHFVQDCIEELCPNYSRECIEQKKDEILSCCKESCVGPDCCKNLYVRSDPSSSAGREGFVNSKNKKDGKNGKDNFILYFLFFLFLIIILTFLILKK